MNPVSFNSGSFGAYLAVPVQQAGETETPTPTAQSPVSINIPIASSSDDAEEATSGWAYLDSTDLELVRDTNDQQVGMRFTGVNIPQGATILNAYIQFTDDSVITKYYYAGGQRIAMRKDGVLSYILSDHLGSTSIVTNATGNIVNQTQYKAWGEVRSVAGNSPTNYTYTGQYSNTADFGLMFYNVRWYDPALGRFTSADTIVPAGVQGYNRYAYVNNNPLRYTDPSGHSPFVTPRTTCDLDCWRAQNQGDSEDGNGGRGSKPIPPCSYCLSIPEPNAYFVSLSLSGGFFSWYGVFSLDTVITDDEIGVFAVYSPGPGFNGGKYFPVGQLNDYKKTFMTPQLGVTLYGGGLWGGAIEESVLNYEGAALVVGAGGGSPIGVDVEYFSSVDPETGIVNFDIQGFGFGPSIGPQPAEFHITYGDAVYQPGLSYAATTIGYWLEIIQP